MDSAIYILNEDTGQIELLNVAEIEAEYRSLVGWRACNGVPANVLLFPVSRERKEYQETHSESLQGGQREEEEVAGQIHLDW